MGPMTISGVAAHFMRRNSNGDRFSRGAFDQSLQSFASGAYKIPLLNSHAWMDAAQVVGSVTEVSTTRNLLRFKAEMAETQLARDLAALVQGGHLEGISIGFAAREFSFVDDGRDIAQADLREISLVAFPADPQAGVRNR